jgi:hypothetical protein
MASLKAKQLDTVALQQTSQLDSIAVPQTSKLDSIALQQTSKYIKDGLTVVSNNTDIIPRDANGNIVVQSGSYIVIEPNSFNFDSKPMLDILDTRFNYFSFPVQITSNPIDVDVSFDFDNISAKYIIPVPTDSQGQPQGLVRVNTSYDSTWYYGDQPSNGLKELQFTGGIQENVNSYTITEDVLNTLKQQNKTLKFTIQIQWTPSTDARTGFVTEIRRRNPNYNPLPVPFIIYKEARKTEVDTSRRVDSSTNPYGFNNTSYPVLQLTYIVDINNTRKGDVYSILTVSGNPSWILAQNCTWDIDIVDIPNPDGNLYANVYSINDDTVILDRSRKVRVRRTAANGNVTTKE